MDGRKKEKWDGKRIKVTKEEVVDSHDLPSRKWTWDIKIGLQRIYIHSVLYDKCLKVLNWPKAKNAIFFF